MWVLQLVIFISHDNTADVLSVFCFCFFYPAFVMIVFGCCKLLGFFKNWFRERSWNLSKLILQICKSAAIAPSVSQNSVERCIVDVFFFTEGIAERVHPRGSLGNISFAFHPLVLLYVAISIFISSCVTGWLEVYNRTKNGKFLIITAKIM